MTRYSTYARYFLADQDHQLSNTKKIVSDMYMSIEILILSVIQPTQLCVVKATRSYKEDDGCISRWDAPFLVYKKS
jgi:hypothetical protein